MTSQRPRRLHTHLLPTPRHSPLRRLSIAHTSEVGQPRHRGATLQARGHTRGSGRVRTYSQGPGPRPCTRQARGFLPHPGEGEARWTTMLKPPRSGAAMSLTNARPADPRGSSQAAARSRFSPVRGERAVTAPPCAWGNRGSVGRSHCPGPHRRPVRPGHDATLTPEAQRHHLPCLGSLVLRVLGSQGRGGAAPGGTLEGEARDQPAAGGDANTPGAGALRAADTDREGRGCGRAGEGRGAERKGGWGTGRHLPAPGRCSESPPQLRAGVCGPGCRGSSSSL